MQYVKIIGVVLIICVMAVGVLIGCKIHKQAISDEPVVSNILNDPDSMDSDDPRFRERIMEKFLDNEDSFEQAKEYFLALPDDVFVLTIYRDKNDDIVTIDGSPHSEEFKIDEDFEQNLSDLAMKLEPMTMNITYIACELTHDGKYIYNKRFYFYLKGGIKPKGIIYLVNDDGSEEELREKVLFMDDLEQIKDNWYYFEEFAGV